MAERPENHDPRDPAPIERLRAVMRRLRDPDGGCPWDLEQDFRSIASYTVEEAHEVAEAIERDDLDDLRDELGDLLFQVVFHAHMAEEQDVFDFDDVARGISDKLVRRHPHVFAERRNLSPEEQTREWERIKAEERGSDDPSELAGVSRGLPALRRAVKLQKRAGRVGFDWPDARSIIAKMREELDELELELDEAAPERIRDEVGDLLFVVANLARKLDCDPGGALRHANAKFERRFRLMETLAEADGRRLADLPLDEQEALWQRAKRELRNAPTVPEEGSEPV